MPKMDDDRLVAVLMSGVRQATGYSDSALSRERLTVAQWRDGELPGQLHPGNSSYVSMDVRDGHEAMKAQLVETFTGNLQPVKFAPTGPDDVVLARSATEYCNYVIFGQNDGYNVIGSVIGDGLSARAGIAKVWWEPLIEEVEYELAAESLQGVMAGLAENKDLEVSEVELEDGGKGAKARLKGQQDLSQVHIKPLPPEEFFITPRATCLKDALLCGHRYKTTISRLERDGYDVAKLREVTDTNSLWMSTEPELLQRHAATDDIALDAPLDTGQEGDRTVTVYECYAELDFDDSGEIHLWQAVICANILLHKERVRRRPFVTFTPLPRPHAFWGENFDQLSIPIQRARTALVRSIVDHAMVTTNPRYTVVRGGVLNPAELMEQRLGGIVNVSRPDAVLPLPQAALNPFIYQTIALMETDKEQRTGISKLSTGLNKDAISKQNSGAMIEQLVSLSQVRQKVVARNFAEGFLRDLYLMVYELVVENEKTERIIEIAGEWVPVDPTNWPERDRVQINFALGYGEAEREANRLVEVDQYLTRGGVHTYTPERRYGILRDALEARGLKNVTAIIGTPQEAAQPPPPDPKMVAEVRMKEADAKAKEAAAMATLEKVKLDRQIAAQNFEIEKMRIQLNMVRESNKLQLDRDKLAHKVAVDTFEVQQTAAVISKADKDTATAVVNPSGS